MGRRQRHGPATLPAAAPAPPAAFAVGGAVGGARARATRTGSDARSCNCPPSRGQTGGAGWARPEGCTGRRPAGAWAPAPCGTALRHRACPPGRERAPGGWFRWPATPRSSDGGADAPEAAGGWSQPSRPSPGSARARWRRPAAAAESPTVTPHSEQLCEKKPPPGPRGGGDHVARTHGGPRQQARRSLPPNYPPAPGGATRPRAHTHA